MYSDALNIYVTYINNIETHNNWIATLSVTVWNIHMNSWGIGNYIAYLFCFV